LDYPIELVEIVFSVASQDDPAILVVNDIRARYPEVDSKVSVGLDAMGVNPKINNIGAAYKSAK
jgi:ceramide glucosyltransferase